MFGRTARIALGDGQAGPNGNGRVQENATTPTTPTTPSPQLPTPSPQPPRPRLTRRPLAITLP